MPITIIAPKFEQISKRIWGATATESEMAEIGLADVLAIKSDLDHKRFRYVPGARRGARSSDDDAKRIVAHVASDETPDRMGDIIRVAGWELGNFKQNPMLLWMHDHNHPIGVVESTKKGKADDGRKALLTDSRIHEGAKSLKGLDNEVIYQLVKDGDLPAVSVGFQALDVQRPQSEEERLKLGLGPYGVVYPQSELLELSVVSIGANPNALRRSLDAAVEAKRIDATTCEAISKMLAQAFDASSKVCMVTVPAMPKSQPAGDQAAPAADSDAESQNERAADNESVTRAISENNALLKRLIDTQIKLSEVLTTLSVKLESMTSSAVGAVDTSSNTSVDGSPAGANESSRATSSEDFYERVMQATTKAVREAFDAKSV